MKSVITKKKDRDSPGRGRNFVWAGGPEELRVIWQERGDKGESDSCDGKCWFGREMVNYHWSFCTG